MISIIMLICDSSQSLDRAVRSVLSQTFCEWELLALAAGSEKTSLECLEGWARRDERVRAIHIADRLGSGAKRNIGLRRAVGATVAYLSCDGEYYEDYLNHIDTLRERADVLIFGCDRVEHRGIERVPLESWSPADYRADLFWLGGSAVLTLGVAHSRDLALRVGGFDENLWVDGEGELLKRIARSGATFLYSGHKSGCQHLRGGGRSRASLILPEQRAAAEANYRAGRPLYHCSAGTAGRRSAAKKVLFASAHSILDFTSGASVATLDVLQGLTDSGFECQAFCMPKLDANRDVCFEQIIRDTGEPFQLRPSLCGSQRATVLYTRRHRVPITFIQTRSTRLVIENVEEILAALGFFRRLLEVFRPDAMLTFGADPITLGMIALAKSRDVPVVYAIHNFGLRNFQALRNVDYCIAPSAFLRRFYWEGLGVACGHLPNPVNWDRVRASQPRPQYVTFINPSPEKGVYPFARIAAELGIRRPDIHLLVVESRGTRETLAACGTELAARANIRFMSNCADPREFWGVTRVALMPSLWWENQPLVAIEAMINGIPVIGSDRGGIPETLGDAGYLLPLPERLTPTSGVVPSAEEVEPWVETIIRLWDDATLYGEQSAKAVAEAQRWHPDRLRPLYAEFFRNVQPQPGPPFLPKEG